MVHPSPAVSGYLLGLEVKMQTLLGQTVSLYNGDQAVTEIWSSPV